MSNPPIIPTPWDGRAFNCATYELLTIDKESLKYIQNHPGHYTAKIDPLDIEAKKLLHQHSFYYCDTLIEPYANKASYQAFPHTGIELISSTDISDIKPMLQRHFIYDRFHRDFHVKPSLADLRYENWVQDLIDQHEVYLFTYDNAVIGFVACQINRLQLHAIAKKFQNRGLSKYCWSTICSLLFEKYDEVTSSISSANLAILNLYSRLGFKFRNATDVYHKVIS